MHYTFTPNDPMIFDSLLLDIDSVSGEVNRLCLIDDPTNVTDDDYTKLAERGNDSPVSVLGIDRAELDDNLSTNGVLKPVN